MCLTYTTHLSCWLHAFRRFFYEPMVANNPCDRANLDARAWLAESMKGTTMHGYILNIEAVGLLFSKVFL